MKFERALGLSLIFVLATLFTIRNWFILEKKGLVLSANPIEKSGGSGPDCRGGYRPEIDVSET